MVRGINKSNIFEDAQDKARFLERLGETIIKGKCAVYAWVLMNNHVHILFKSAKDGMSAVMRKLLMWYSGYFNRRHRRTGHLFENRYKSKCPWMDMETVLSQFGNTKRKAISEYRNFVQEDVGKGRNAELTGGGLIRSQGGWSQVLSMRRKGVKEAADERILGNGDFVHQILKELEEKELRQAGLDIGEIIRQECRKSRISQEELKRGKVSDGVPRLMQRWG
jgi:REP element-mobilizing transposase RayT